MNMGPRAHVGVTPAAGEISSAPAEGRFVQFPTDVERSVATPYEARMSATFEVREKSGPLSTQRAALLAGVAALLHRFTQQSTIPLDVFDRSLGAGVSRTELSLMIRGEASFSETVAQSSAALERALASRTSGSANPSNVAVHFIDAPPAGSESLVPDAYDLQIVFTQSLTHLQVALGSNARLLEASSIDRLRSSLLTLLEAAERVGETTIELLPLLQPAEVRALTIERDSGTATYPLEPVQRRFEAHALKTPSARAVVLQDESLTYGELDERSNRLANLLVKGGVGPEVPVAVCMRPSVDVVVAILAIFKARGVYFPLDPTHPPALIKRMMVEARPRFVLTHSELMPLTGQAEVPAPKLAPLTGQAEVTQFAFDAAWATLSTLPATPPPQVSSLEDAAYLLYTSGTTGKPKGVVATHANLAHYLHVAQQRYGFTAADRFSSLARYTFSISLFDLLSPLCCGGSVRMLPREDVLVPERLCQYLEQLTVLHAGPSLLASLFRYLKNTPSAPRTFPRMRHVSTGGDMVPPSVMEEMKRVFENAEVFVIYGCTEISCMGTTFPVDRQSTITRSFVGKPFPDVTLQVLDPRRNLVPYGVVGEICFAGKGIVREYLHRPELTQEKFIDLDGQRFYQTGDLGRLHSNGNLEILGRRDFQVQLRGIRIELFGIEKTVLELGLAAQCAVASKTVGDDDVRLVAFVVKPSVTTMDEFRRALAEELPEYMLPQHVVVLEGMPLTTNGKLDRHQLRELPWDTQLGHEVSAAPRDELERTIAQVFCRLLGTSSIGVDDDFFTHGGHSLLAVMAISDIESALGVQLPKHALFQGATVRALAELARTTTSSEPRPILLNKASDDPALFMLSGIHIYRELARHLEGRVRAYGVFAERELGTLEDAKESYSVEALAADYIDIIRRHQPKGPYRILGYSFAGIVAFEVAQQLRAAGEEIRFLGLLDAVLPEWTLGFKFRLAQLARVPRVPLRDLAAYFKRRLKTSREPPHAEFIRYAGDQALGPMEEKRDAVNRQAAARYLAHIRPYYGSVTLIACRERLKNDPLKSASCGWRPHAPRLNIHGVDGDHFRIMSDEPYVSSVAAILRHALALRELPT
jgi:amino acid adenylation domain-containing protein